MLVSPRRNHSNSCTIERRCSFLVVTSGKPSRRSKRICQPNTLRVPVPVRSPFSVPCSSTWPSSSRYCRISALRRRRLQGRGAPRLPQPEQPQRDQRQAQQLPHGQPAEREVAELGVGDPHEL